MFFRRCRTEKANRDISSPASSQATTVTDSAPCGTAQADCQPVKPAPRAKAKRRGSVSAEVSALSLVSVHKRKVVEKSDEAKARIRAAIKHSFLFKDLEEEQEHGIVDAMFEKTAEPGELIIREGEEGDNFYVIECGEYVAVKGGVEVSHYDGRGAFGELALMYNCPRAATVQAVTAGVLWGVDRVTFRDIIVASAAARRARFDGALAAMPIFSGLTPEQRAAIADCLEPESASEGDYILLEGARLGRDAKFYLVESGTVRCLKTYEDGGKRLVATITDGGFFGEVALVTHAPRAADCVAASDKVRLLFMGRDAFERLMGPVEEILAEKVREYEELNERARRDSARPAEAAQIKEAAQAGRAAAAANGDAAPEAAPAAGDGSAEPEEPLSVVLAEAERVAAAACGDAPAAEGSVAASADGSPVARLPQEEVSDGEEP